VVRRPSVAPIPRSYYNGNANMAHSNGDNSNFWTILVACATTGAVVGGMFWGLLQLTIGPIREHQQDDLAQAHKEIDKINLTMSPLLTLYAQHAADEEKFQSLQKQLDGKLDLNVHNGLAEAEKQDRATLLDTTNKTLDEIRHQIHELENKIVSREENVVHWDYTARLEARLNQLADRVGSLPPTQLPPAGPNK